MRRLCRHEEDQALGREGLLCGHGAETPELHASHNSSQICMKLCADLSSTEKITDNCNFVCNYNCIYSCTIIEYKKMNMYVLDGRAFVYYYVTYLYVCAMCIC